MYKIFLLESMLLKKLSVSNVSSFLKSFLLSTYAIGRGHVKNYIVIRLLILEKLDKTPSYTFQNLVGPKNKLCISLLSCRHWLR